MEFIILRHCYEFPFNRAQSVKNIIRIKNVKKKIINLIQVIVSISLLILIFRRIDWNSFIQTFLTASPIYVICSVLLFFFIQVASCFRWHSILTVEKVNVPIGLLFRWQLVGILLNNFLPTSVGGDIGRGYFAGRFSGKFTVIGRSILIDRLFGVIWLLFFAWLGAVYFGYGQLATLSVVITLTILIGLFFLLYKRRYRSFPQMIVSIFDYITTSVKLYTLNWGSFFLQLTLGLFIQLGSMLVVWINLQAVATGLDIVPSMLISAITNAASLVPISINGWGIRETVFIFLSNKYSIDMNTILAGLFLGRALLLLVSFMGLFPLLLEIRKRGSTEL